MSQATPAVAAAAAAAQRGALVCPGVAAQVEPTGLAYPTVAAAPVSVQFGCNVDCLYLVTLDGAGRPPRGRPPGRTARRRCAGDDHAADGEARRRAVSRRRAARGVGQPRPDDHAREPADRLAR